MTSDGGVGSRSPAGGIPLVATSDLIVGAHADDVELLGLTVIADPASSVTAVVCTDGAGSPVAGLAGSSPASIEERRREQEAAAAVGGYRQLVHLGLPSAGVRADGVGLDTRLAEIVAAVRPIRIVTHNPADAHPTHVRVVAALLRAVRAQQACRPTVLGVEIWRSLDWLPLPAKVVLDASGLDALGDRLLAPFTSQLAAKRYDRAAAARRRANATFLRHDLPDAMDAAVFAMDLTPVARNEIDLRSLVAQHLDHFRADILAELNEPDVHIGHGGGV